MQEFYNFLQSVFDFSVCSSCGGYCCKRCGCHYSPDDFSEISYEYLRKEIEKGYISIDYVDREALLAKRGVYFLRVRNVEAPILDVGFRKSATCILNWIYSFNWHCVINPVWLLTNKYKKRKKFRKNSWQKKKMLYNTYKQ